MEKSSIFGGCFISQEFSMFLCYLSSYQFDMVEPTFPDICRSLEIGALPCVQKVLENEDLQTKTHRRLHFQSTRARLDS